MPNDKTAGKRRRFYKTVDVAPDGAAFSVLLDGRRLKTPGRNDLCVATDALARAVADEWDAQTEHIDPHAMPITQIACTAIDRMPTDGTSVRETIAGYAGTDLLCYRASQPSDLVERQTEVWQPILDWLSSSLGARLQSTTSLMALEQDASALTQVSNAVNGLDDHELAAVAVLTQASGSFVLAWAVYDGHLTPDAAADAAQLDEDYQSTLWGQDREAQQRLANLRADIHAAAQYLALLRA